MTARHTTRLRCDLPGSRPSRKPPACRPVPTRRLTIQDGFGNDPTKEVTNTFAVARNYVLPYAQTWNFALQDEFKGGIVVEANYLGTKGTRLDVLRLPNRAAPGSPLTAEQRRQIGNAVGFTFDSSEGNSIFHAVQLRVIRRLRRGLSTNIFYTFSKSIDNASSIGGAGNIVAQDDRNLAAERGPVHLRSAASTELDEHGQFSVWRTRPVAEETAHWAPAFCRLESLDIADGSHGQSVHCPSAR